MGMLTVHVPQTRQAEHWICKNNLNGSGLRKWIELFLFRLCHGWWSAQTVNGRTKLEFACKYTDTITQSIVLKCAVCRTQKEIKSHSECTHSIPPKSKTSPSPTWSIASSIASSKVCTSGTTSSSESMSMTVLPAFSWTLHALAAFIVFLSKDFSRSRLMATRSPSMEAALSKQLDSGRSAWKRPRTCWRTLQSGCRCSWSFLKMRDSHACSFWTSTSKFGSKPLWLFLNLPYHFLPSSVR